MLEQFSKCQLGIVLSQVVSLLMDFPQCAELLNPSSDDQSDNNSTTPLHLAAKNGHVDTLR